ncbi:MAG: PSD1 and planctomycete cytochrome C domain-containing protein [Planctomycetes bacterium]|nr:PSD1 and planctomycete cytochrome C domain-containing protein [Planctomycetota bacterium]
MRHRLALIAYCAAGLAAWAPLPAAASDAADRRAALEFFEKRIRPVLVQSCYECHSAKTATPKGGLRLDSRQGVLTGGDSGASIVPGKPAESLLIEALRYESLQMPPKAQLPQETIADFVRWIEMGAPDPRDGADSAADDDSWQTILAARRDWWSLRPVIDPPVPASGAGWAAHAVDRFIASQLEDAGLAPAPPADARTLIRRLSLVLTGLPPAWDDVERFQQAFAEDSDAACAALVDRLLASPHFGERWARHWMDVVRFSETHGNEWNYEVHHAWRYRDYLIRALGADVPWDRLVREHIAGDLLEPRWNNELQLNESPIGTAFYRFGEVNHDDCVSLTSIGYDILDNQIDTLSKAFQATTIACARCHHHKLDAVSMEDYYALLGILKSSRPTAHTLDAAAVNAAPLKQLRKLKPLIREEVARHWQSQAELLPRYLLAADAQLRGAAEAGSLAEGLEPARLEKWVAALKVENPGLDHPVRAWQTATRAEAPAAKWQELAAEHAAARESHASFNTNDFSAFGNFRPQAGSDHELAASWHATGQGLRDAPAASGDFTIAHTGDDALASILPAGTYTHTLSQKLNGTLRSPLLPAGWKYLSVQVLGEKTSAFRLVSNNCQLNYANYRALTSAKPTWVTFPIPEQGQALGTFAELVTKFNNPKFPDQLGTLGGDTSNARIPWSEAAADPRSWFGIRQAVLHNQPDPPKPDLTALARLFANAEVVTSRETVAARYGEAVGAAVAAWSAGTATDDDVEWLSWVLEHGLLDHSLAASPRLDQLVTEYRQIEHELQQPRLAPGLADPPGEGYDHPLLERGDYRQPGRPVPRRYLEVLTGPTEAEGAMPFVEGSGRRQLAEAIASPHNPLTARVIVNRIWHHLFGTGLVRSVDDFGRVGERPSHPELLDFLAARFSRPREEGGLGWSTKALIREIVLSQTFRMSNRASNAGRMRDPENRLLHHYPARRLEAEAIRDSILAVAGRLDRRFFGTSIQPYREESNADRRLFAGPLDGDGRRSVYIKVNLMEGPAFLSSFNIPGGKLAQGRRDVTNVPAQALTLLNDGFVRQQAGLWGERVAASNADTVEERLHVMLRHALGREPEPAEAATFEQLVRSLAELHGVSPGAVLASGPVWSDVAHVLFNLKEFIYIP